MADIEIVVKLSEKNYEHLKRLGALWIESENGLSIVSKALLEGTILPQGHGKLKDADAMINKLCTHEASEFFGNVTCAEIMDLINDADTIVEADVESEGGKE